MYDLVLLHSGYICLQYLYLLAQASSLDFVDDWLYCGLNFHGLEDKPFERFVQDVESIHEGG